MIVLETNRLTCQGIEMRSFYDRIAMAGEVAVSLVVSDNNDDIGIVGSGQRYGQTGAESES